MDYIIAGAHAGHKGAIVILLPLSLLVRNLLLLLLNLLLLMVLPLRALLVGVPAPHDSEQRPGGRANSGALAGVSPDLGAYEAGSLLPAYGPRSTGAVCGNGVREGAEECDDGNTTSGDGCSSTCTLEAGPPGDGGVGGGSDGGNNNNNGGVDGGCGCRVAGQSPGGTAMAVLALLGLAVGCARRRYKR